MNKILIISGPTATGKTALAVSLLKKIKGEIISADSRQIYIGMDIGVGKDHPTHTPIHLIDLITPDKIFSASQYSQLALSKINDLHQQNKLPVVVGGTGFYIDSIINNQKYNHFNTKSFSIWRRLLDCLPLWLLQKTLHTISPDVYNHLNQSDINNPRRLSRKIEIAFSRKSESSSTPYHPHFDILHISLTAPNSFLYKRIDKRVDDRLKMGHLKELSNLLKKYPWSAPGLKVSCYRHFKNYLQGKEELVDVVGKWQFSEHRDARHQKTWFKKYPQAIFVDVSTPSSLKKISRIIDRWYNNSSI